MKIILSRKGLDSTSGKLCNPILPDGTLLSMPIPGESKHPVYYKDLYFDIKDIDGNSHQMSYEEILTQLGSGKWERGQQSHLDPDLREGIIERKQDYLPAFGQCRNAKKFLDNRNVKEGDLFLFFGRFKKTEFNSKGKLQYRHKAPEQHIIYGYIQVGKILHNCEIDEHFKCHPHAGNGKDNNLYLPTERLTLNPNMPGAGVLSYSYKRVLTKYGMSISKWNLPDFFRGLDFDFEDIDKLASIINGVTAYDEFGEFDSLYSDQLTYCRFHHRIMAFDVDRCSGCPLLQGNRNGRGADCLYDVPVKRGRLLELPYTPRNLFVFYEILTQKGIVGRKDNRWDLM